MGTYYYYGASSPEQANINDLARKIKEENPSALPSDEILKGYADKAGYQVSQIKKVLTSDVAYYKQPTNYVGSGYSEAVDRAVKEESIKKLEESGQITKQEAAKRRELLGEKGILYQADIGGTKVRGSKEYVISKLRQFQDRYVEETPEGRITIIPTEQKRYYLDLVEPEKAKKQMSQIESAKAYYQGKDYEIYGQKYLGKEKTARLQAALSQPKYPRPPLEMLEYGLRANIPKGEPGFKLVPDKATAVYKTAVEPIISPFKQVIPKGLLPTTYAKKSALKESVLFPELLKFSEETGKAAEKAEAIARDESKGYKRIPAAAASFSLGAAEAATRTVAHPLEFATQTIYMIGHPIKSTIGIGLQFLKEPARTAGQFYGIKKVLDVGGKAAEVAIKTPGKVDMLIGSYKLSRALKGKPTTAIMRLNELTEYKGKNYTEAPGIDLDITYKPLEWLKGTQVVRGKSVLETIEPVYGEKITAKYSDLEAQPPVAKIEYKTNILRRDIPKGPKDSKLPSKEKARAFDVQQAGIFYMLQEDLIGFKYPISRAYKIKTPEGISDIRRWATTRATIEPGMPEPNIFTKRTTASERKLYPPGLPEPRPTIEYTFKLPGKRYLVTESGELLGGMKYGYGETFIPAPKKIKTIFESKLNKIKGPQPVSILQKPTAKPLPLPEFETEQGGKAVTIQLLKEPKEKLTQLSEQKLKQLSEQKLKSRFGIIEKVKVTEKQKAKAETESIFKEAQKVKPLQDTDTFQRIAEAYKSEAKAKSIFTSRLYEGARQKQDSITSSLIKTSSDTIQSQKQESAQIIDTLQVPKLDVATLQKTDTLQELKTTPDIKTRSNLFIKGQLRPGIIAQPSKKIIPKPFRTYADEKRKGGIFTAEVRRKGTFYEIGKYETPEKAFTAAKIRVSSTPAASLRVKNIYGEAVKKPLGLGANQFFRSKKEPGVFIERKEKRIKSAGELLGITSKGLATLKSRRAKGIFNTKTRRLF